MNNKTTNTNNMENVMYILVPGKGWVKISTIRTPVRVVKSK